MTHTPLELQALLAAAAGRFVSPPEAQLFAELYTDTHLRKAPRMNPLAEALADLKVWQGAADRQFSVVQDKKGVLILDMNGLAPALKIKYIHDELSRRASEFGMAAVGLKNTAGIITLNMWADGLARRDQIGLAMFNGGTECCVPHGGRRGVLGTNPLAYAIPTLTDPLQMDMATTEIPFFDLKNAKAAGSPLPEGVAVDQQGLPTTDAAQALSDSGVANLLPLGGGMKGFGIVMLVEILTGALVQSLLSTSQSSGWHPKEYGCLILALDIGSFTAVDRFKEEVSALCTSIRAMEPAEGSSGISLPGDRGHAAKRLAEDRQAIVVEPDFLAELQALSA